MAAITAANRIIDATIWAASNKSNWPDETSSCKLLLLMVVYQVITFTSVMAIEATILLIVLILLIGFSRIYLRVHYTSDVLAGFLIGLIWLLITLAVVEKAEQMTIENDLLFNFFNLKYFAADFP